MDLFGLGNAAGNAWLGAGSSDPDALRAMTEAQLQKREQMLWDQMRPSTPTLAMMQRMTNCPQPRRPVVTLAEWDARRAAFSESSTTTEK